MKSLFLIFLSLAVSAPLYARQWENLTRPWLDNLEGWVQGSNPYSARVSSIECDPNTGLVYLILPNRMGVWTSTDHGDTWTQADGGLFQGRHFGGHSCTLNPKTGSLVVFALKTGFTNAAGENEQILPQSVATCDLGKTWHSFGRPPVGKGGKENSHDGWTWGAVDWSNCPPQVMLTKEHHTRPGDIWLTRDGGETWTHTGAISRHLGLLDANTFVIGDENGIQLSTDGAQTWEKVSDFVPGSQIAVPYEGKLYWTAGNSLIVTEDGRNWEKLGNPLPQEIQEGPHFGRSADEMMVVVRYIGAVMTQDGGETWKKISDGPDAKGIRGGYTWDPVNHILYCSKQSETGDAFRLQYDPDALEVVPAP